MKTIIVLSDGETWDTLEGCRIAVLDEDDYEDLADGKVSPKNVGSLELLRIVPGGHPTK
jgi:hypothetical protein